ncbi:Putative auto-transporter adhesin, head GIN domain [Flaviramulus basaltis]|uniref:Putative auto-transporter adhesin, head GIN domain n=1 Tax=Flaviramulus basaltis TaxID=369401 RepID=A0A1K2IL61_9FLAO|nr:DUF2807 domain-containing protein [Flaviramulus basaltis]SFZ93018.1 Putative auto-transporter adhesin, head GIN domain [Flaviramulus basaltis]
MKKILIAFFFCLLINGLSIAQNPEKVKGNRNVTTQLTDIDSFHTIALDEDFKVDIIYSQNASVEIETDENLHEFIKFEVIDSVLTFKKTTKITSKKRLDIKVTYNEFLKHIITSGNAEILSLSTMNLKNGTLKTRGSSKAGLTIKSDDFSFNGDDKSKVKLNLTSENCTLNLSGYSKIEALINTSQISATLYQRANADIEGTCNNATLELDNNTQLNAKNFTINNCSIVSSIGSDAYLEVLENITIDASGTCAIYLYENPKIVINKLTDTSKLQKKVK